MKRLFAILAAGVLLASAVSCAFAADAKGRVEAVVPGLFAVREGKSIPIDVDAEIYEFDVLETDATGSGLIRFVDDSTLELQGNSRLDVKEVVFSEERDRFNVGLVHGAARVITGAIVKRNPRAFKVTTPKTTIGVRGTTLYIEVTEEYERVTVEELSEGSSVLLRNTLEERKFTMTQDGDSVTIRVVTQIDTDSGAVGVMTETTLEGGGVFEGDRKLLEVILRPDEREHNDRDRSQGGGQSPGSGGNDCCGDSSSPGR
jgi:hypothetical protein